MGPWLCSLYLVTGNLAAVGSPSCRSLAGIVRQSCHRAVASLQQSDSNPVAALRSQIGHKLGRFPSLFWAQNLSPKMASESATYTFFLLKWVSSDPFLVSFSEPDFGLVF